ncbi:MAG TPA: pirin family protein [Thermoplasmata archaeon]|nr:pirin family protein [Thermoplasmata archaeon]
MTESDSNPPRRIEAILPSRETIEGAGVHLRRAFGYYEVPRLDPFLMLDDFRSQNPAEFVAGFPWHPHRGIETVTYMIDGFVQHEDSIGNKGVIRAGDVQWMTAGSGIIHQEMPKHLDDGKMGGFQLWVNLPADHKMMDPRYREVKSGVIPQFEAAKGVTVRVIAGEVHGVQGPVRDIVVEPEYLDVRIEPHGAFEHSIKEGHRAFAYVLGGRGRFDEDSGEIVDHENLILYRDGDRVRIEAMDQPLRFLLVSGKPLHEPVAWWGPIVMNNRRELEAAVQEFQNGTFVKQGAAVA